MKKVLFSAVCLLLISALLLAGCGGQKTASSDSSTNSSGLSQAQVSSNSGPSSDNHQSGDKVFRIGISQFVEHPALDAARKGFIDGLKEAGFEEGKNATFEVENAQADFPTTQTIANKFAGEKVDMILAIATPSAQSAANATKDIPILITAVTDPVAAGLVKSLDKPGTNVTGTTDMNPIKEQLQLLKQILPDAKNVGILYNAAEANSKVQVDIAKKAAGELGLTIHEATVANSSEVNQAVQTIAGKVDAIYAPTDNTVASSIGAIIKACNDAKIPVIGAERGMVDGGALATLGIDYYLLGKQTGKVAARILKGEKPADIAIEGSKDFKLIINKKSANTLGIKIPETLMSKADEIIEK